MVKGGYRHGGNLLTAAGIKQSLTFSEQSATELNLREAGGGVVSCAVRATRLSADVPLDHPSTSHMMIQNWDWTRSSWASDTCIPLSPAC